MPSIVFSIFLRNIHSLKQSPLFRCRQDIFFLCETSRPGLLRLKGLNAITFLVASINKCSFWMKKLLNQNRFVWMTNSVLYIDDNLFFSGQELIGIYKVKYFRSVFDPGLIHWLLYAELSIAQCIHYCRLYLLYSDIGCSAKLNCAFLGCVVPFSAMVCSSHRELLYWTAV